MSIYHTQYIQCKSDNKNTFLYAFSISKLHKHYPDCQHYAKQKKLCIRKTSIYRGLHKFSTAKI